MARSTPYTGPARPPTQSMIYTSGTTGRPKGVRRKPATPEQEVRIARSRRLLYGLESDCTRHGAGTALPFGAEWFCAEGRQGDGSHPFAGALRAGGVPRRRRALPHYDAVYGADHVRAPAETARGDAAALRYLVAHVRHACSGAVSAGRQTRHDRLVRADHLGVLRRHRDRRHHHDLVGGVAGKSRAPLAG